jgi:hypothetical protein
MHAAESVRFESTDFIAESKSVCTRRAARICDLRCRAVATVAHFLGLRMALLTEGRTMGPYVFFFSVCCANTTIV